MIPFHTHQTVQQAPMPYGLYLQSLSFHIQVFSLIFHSSVYPSFHRRCTIWCFSLIMFFFYWQAEFTSYVYIWDHIGYNSKTSTPGTKWNHQQTNWEERSESSHLLLIQTLVFGVQFVQILANLSCCALENVSTLHGVYLMNYVTFNVMGCCTKPQI